MLMSIRIRLLIICLPIIVGFIIPLFLVGTFSFPFTFSFGLSTVLMILIDIGLWRWLELERLKNHEQEVVPLYRTILPHPPIEKYLYLKGQSVDDFSEDFQANWEELKQAYMESKKKDGWKKLDRMIRFLDKEPYLMKKLVETTPPFYDLERIERERIKFSHNQVPLIYEDEMTLKMRFSFQFQLITYHLNKGTEYEKVLLGYTHDSYKEWLSKGIIKYTDQKIQEFNQASREPKVDKPQQTIVYIFGDKNKTNFNSGQQWNQKGNIQYTWIQQEQKEQFIHLCNQLIISLQNSQQYNQKLVESLVESLKDVKNQTQSGQVAQPTVQGLSHQLINLLGVIGVGTDLYQLCSDLSELLQSLFSI